MVFFDLDDTILDHAHAERTAAMEFFRLNRAVFSDPPEEFVARWRTTARKHIGRYIRGELSFQGQRRERIRELFAGRETLTDAEADRLFGSYLLAYEENWRPFPDVARCLADLGGTRVGIITNGDGEQQRKKIDVLGLTTRFSPIVVSGEVGVSKPDADIFLLACLEAGESPSESWHVGDDLRIDAEGSAAAGLHGVWLDRNGLPRQEGVTTVSSLSELKTLIRRD